MDKNRNSRAPNDKLNEAVNRCMNMTPETNNDFYMNLRSKVDKKKVNDATPDSYSLGRKSKQKIEYMVRDFQADLNKLNYQFL